MGRPVRKLHNRNEVKAKDVEAKLPKDKDPPMLQSPRKTSRPIHSDGDEQGDVMETAQEAAAAAARRLDPLQDAAVNLTDINRGYASPFKCAKTPDRSKFHQAVMNSPLPALHHSPLMSPNIPLFQNSSPCKFGLSPLGSFRGFFGSPTRTPSQWPFTDSVNLGLETPGRDISCIFAMTSPLAKPVNVKSETAADGQLTQQQGGAVDTSKSSSTQHESKSCNTTDSKSAPSSSAMDTDVYKSFLNSPNPPLGGFRPPRTDETKTTTRTAKRMLDYSKAENPLSPMNNFLSSPSFPCPELDKVFSGAMNSHDQMRHMLGLVIQQTPAAAALRDTKDSVLTPPTAPDTVVPQPQVVASQEMEVPQPVPVDVHVSPPVSSSPPVAPPVEQYVPESAFFKREELIVHDPVFLKSPPVKSPRWPARATPARLYRTGSGERGGLGKFRQTANVEQYAPVARMPETPSDSRKSEQTPVSAHNKMCHCKKSQCLKLYCECFAAGLYCQNCSCHNCKNQPEHSDLVLQKREQIRQRDPDAFSTKILADTNASARHKRGCNCRKSHCLKKYCECFQAGVKCADLCKCIDCQNLEDFGSSASQSKVRAEPSRGWHVAPEPIAAGLPATPQISTTRSGEGTPRTPSHQSSVTSAGLSNHPNVRRSLHMPPPSLPPSSGSMASGISMSINQAFPGSGYSSQPPTPHSTLSTSSATPIATRHPNMLTSPPQGPLFQGASPLLRSAGMVSTSNPLPSSFSQRFGSPPAPLSFPPSSMLPCSLPFTSTGLPPSPALQSAGSGGIPRALSPSPRIDLAPATCIDNHAGDADDSAGMDGRLPGRRRLMPPGDLGSGLKRSLSMQLMQDPPHMDKPVASMLPHHGSTPNLHLYKPEPQQPQLQTQSSLGHTPRHRASSPRADMSNNLFSPNAAPHAYQDQNTTHRRPLNSLPADMPATPLLQTRSLPLYHSQEPQHLTPQHSTPQPSQHAPGSHSQAMQSSMTSAFAQSYVQAQHPLVQHHSINTAHSSDSPSSPMHPGPGASIKPEPEYGHTENVTPAVQHASKLMRVASIQYQGTPGLPPLGSQHSVSATSEAEIQQPPQSIKSESPRAMLNDAGGMDGTDPAGHGMTPMFAAYSSGARTGEGVSPLVRHNSLPHERALPPRGQGSISAPINSLQEVSMDKAVPVNAGDGNGQQQHVGFLVTIAGSQYFVPAVSGGQPTPASGVTIEPVMQAALSGPLTAPSLGSRPPTPKLTTSVDLRPPNSSFGATANSQIPDAAVGALPANEGMPPVGSIPSHEAMPLQAVSQQAALAQAVALATQQASIPASPNFEPHQRTNSPALHTGGSQHMAFHATSLPSPSMQSRGEFNMPNTHSMGPNASLTSAGGNQLHAQTGPYDYGGHGVPSMPQMDMGPHHEDMKGGAISTMSNGMEHAVRHSAGPPAGDSVSAASSAAAMPCMVTQYESMSNGQMHGSMTSQGMGAQDGSTCADSTMGPCRPMRTTPVKRSRELSFGDVSDNITPLKAGRPLLGPDTPCEALKSMDLANGAIPATSSDGMPLSLMQGLPFAPYVDTQMKGVRDMIFSPQGSDEGMRSSEVLHSGVRMDSEEDFTWMSQTHMPASDMGWGQSPQPAMHMKQMLMAPHSAALAAVALTPPSQGGSQS